MLCLTDVSLEMNRWTTASQVEVPHDVLVEREQPGLESINASRVCTPAMVLYVRQLSTTLGTPVQTDRLGQAPVLRSCTPSRSIGPAQYEAEDEVDDDSRGRRDVGETER